MVKKKTDKNRQIFKSPKISKCVLGLMTNQQTTITKRRVIGGISLKEMGRKKFLERVSKISKIAIISDG